jgi:hypothetical protein
MANPQAKRTIQAHDSNDRLHCHAAHLNTARMNRGEGVDREIIFIIAIHKPAPQKLLQGGQFPFGVICG